MSTGSIKGNGSVPLSVPGQSEAATAPRKRRRKAPSTGAPEDCFTCASRKVECDRRRPYCTQCLDLGRDCSGYKTTLIWGVGVASRGKLRGLSLPIANSKKVPDLAAPRNKRTEFLTRKSAKPSTFKKDPTIGRRSSLESRSCLQSLSPTDVDSSRSSTTGSESNTSSPFLPQSQQNPLENVFDNFVNPSFPRGPLVHPDSFKRPGQLFTYSSPNSNDGQGPCSSCSPASNYQDFAFPAGTRPGPDHCPPQLTSPLSPVPYQINIALTGVNHDSCVILEAPTRGRWYPMTTTSTTASTTATAATNPAFFDSTGVWLDASQTLQFLPGPGRTVNNDSLENDDTRNVPPNRRTVRRSNGPNPTNNNSNYTGITTYTPTICLGNTPRIQFLIEYFDKVISPVIVAFDGPTNPYRSYILPLAAQSETLQHAIAALSASNLRIRRKRKAVSTGKTLPARRSLDAHRRLTSGFSRTNVELFQAIDESREELYHKGRSIQSLNLELADPLKRMEDSTLATLLILCLFHICDSGVAKFRTQFAGVRKLLNLRDHRFGLTPNLRWFITTFTLFDVMTATVNDRDVLFQGDLLNIAALTGDGWTLENLAGCDAHLFKLMARLGRINLLGQGKLVPAHASASASFASHQPRPFSMLDPQDCIDFSILRDVTIPVMNGMPSTQFWEEWNTLRDEICAWQWNPELRDSWFTRMPKETQTDEADLVNISESFRCSALLYLERLAFPGLPSTHPNIQAWVMRSLYHIKNVKSDVFLLWPLFITGSECVTCEDRQVIRQRCVDIQNDSGFFNNIATLELLEQIWRTNPTKNNTDANTSIATPRGFRWRSAMKGMDRGEEYIVI